MRVIDLLSRRLLETDGKFGIEIEVEGAGLAIPRNKYWKVEADGSLRNRPECCEYVFAKPLDHEEAIKAVNWLVDKHKENGTVCNWSFRCSTHVHLNVQKMPVTTLLKLVYTYYIFENLLVKWAGKDREGNRFCLRLADSAEIPFTLEQVFSSNLADINENAIRYAALNLGSLRKYGSIEFRALSGTTDVKRINSWLNAIISLEKYAQEAESIESIFNEAKENINDLGRKVFKEFYKELYSKGWEQSALYNLSCNINCINLYEEVINNEADYHKLVQQQKQERELFEKIRAEQLAALREQEQAHAEENGLGAELGPAKLARALAKARRAAPQ